MNTKLFYFSGTGNSLAAARKIADQIGARNIDNIANFMGQKIEINEDIVGFVFPVYFQDMPEVVKEFVNKIEFKNNPYIFAIATCNGGPGFTLFNMDKILKYKGQKLSSGFTLTMPGNSVIMLDLTSSPEIQKERLRDSSIKIYNISKIVKNQLEVGIEGKYKIKTLEIYDFGAPKILQFLSDRLKGSIISFAVTKVYRAHKRFISSEKCTLCRTCQRICPENNIKVAEIVTWGSNCDLCLACFHWCPQKGIEIGNSTKNRIRYHHPDISLKDMTLR
ncbi:EFR1 family ferrodoxin [Methanobacterium sp. MBAC-LM]|jgi:flavodoxin/Pyruvate/2-oxoacid:ferredoxin oxidoreductase delta subunit|uniref:EFR1 family ferrodoxin n=1 Tax=Methanobacterium sp. MBAC-LM TaxID=3412034 RepID=UPI003C77E754